MFILAIHVAGGTAYGWPASLDPSASHSFSARLFFTCPTGDAGAKYSNWVSVSVEAATPVLSVVLLNQSTVSINLQHFQNYRNIRFETITKHRGRFRGEGECWGRGGGERTLSPSSQGFDPCRPKGSPFVLFWDIHLWLSDLKIFLRAPLAPNYTLRGERAPKKNANLILILQKVLQKTSFLACFFFKIFPAA